MAEEETSQLSPDSEVVEVKKSTETTQADGDSSDDKTDDVAEEISKQVAAGAAYLGGVFSSAWSKTTKTASEVRSSATASSLLTALGGPIRSVDVEPVQMKAEDANETEEVPALPRATTTFFSNAWSKVECLTKSTSWTGEPADEEACKEAKETNESEGNGNVGRLDHLSSIVKAASSATSAIRESFGHLQAPSMLSDFNKEQQEFIKKKSGEEKASVCLAPWIGHQDEDAMKAKILSLSLDKRTFVRAPPSGVSFDFDYSSVSSVAMALLDEDHNLKNMRYELVPKAVKEDEFWRNYFYRVNLIKQSFDLKDFEKSVDKKPSVDREPVESRLAPDEDLNGGQSTATDPDDEFVSDSYQVSSQDMVEVDESMRKLRVKRKSGAGVGTSGDVCNRVPEGDDWEAELEGELNEFEVVSSKDGHEDGPEWENQIQEMLDAEESVK